MSGYNANFRNTHVGGSTGFDGDANFAGSGNVPPLSPVLEPFMDISCGTTTTWDLVESVGFSFFRTDDIITNQRYNARQGNFEIDFPGSIDITVTATGFTPFVSLVRENGYRLTASDGSGVITGTIPPEETGPFTLEVTSIEPYATGTFIVTISCAAGPPFTLAVDFDTRERGRKFTFTVVTNDLATYPPGTSFYVINEGAPSNATQIFHFVTDGSGNATVSGWSRTLGVNTFIVSTFGFTLPGLSNEVTVNITAAPSAVTFSDLGAVLTAWGAFIGLGLVTFNPTGAGGYNSYTGAHPAEDDAASTATTIGDGTLAGEPNNLTWDFTANTGTSFYHGHYTKDDDANGVHYPKGTYTRVDADTGGNSGFVAPTSLTIT